MKMTDTSGVGGIKDDSINPETDQSAPPQASIDDSQEHTIQLSSLQDLKAIFLSMDWEINDQTLDKLICESEKLMESYKDDLVLVAYLKMLSSLGKYIKSRKANADKDAVGLLNSVYDSMEKVIVAEKMPAKERERLVVDEIKKFQVLKQKVTGSKGALPKKKCAGNKVDRREIQNIKADMATLHEEVAELREQVTRILEIVDQ